MNEDEDRVEYAEQNRLLRRQFDTVLTEPIPARMYLKRPGWQGYARAAMLVAAGIAIVLLLFIVGDILGTGVYALTGKVASVEVV